MNVLDTLRIVRGTLFIFAGVCGLGLWAWQGDADYLLGGLVGLGFGVWDIWTSVSDAGEDEERRRTSSERVEAATAGLESVSRRHGDA